MFNLDRKQIITLAGFLIILVSIPLAAFMIKQTQIFQSRASKEIDLLSQQKILKKEATKSATKSAEVPPTSPLTDLERLLQTSPTPTPNDISPTPIINLAFGPTLNLKIELEGRPPGKQAAKVFVGISTGTTKANPTYLLTFTLDFPDSGFFQGLSLAGLNPGSTYTAYVKGPAQIDTASTFVMGPTETNLNNNQALTLTSGDLNEDNTINSADYTIAKGVYGTTSSSKTWNSRADLNLDGVINNLDLSLIIKNMGKTGASATWFSPPPQATSSGRPASGYWLFVP